MKKLAAVLTLAMGLTAAAYAQGRDLAGTWNFDAAKTGPLKEEAPKSGPESAGSRRADGGGPRSIVITQTPKTISIAMGDPAHALVFNADGSETSLDHDGKGKIEWKGDKLGATIITPRGPQTAWFYRQGTWLVMEQPGPVAMKMYFSPAASAKK